MTDKLDEKPDLSDLGLMRGDQIPETSPEEMRAREARFRRGAHHAVDNLATALERATSVEMCQRIANIYTNLIGDARHAGRGDFDLSTLAREAEKKALEGDG